MLKLQHEQYSQKLLQRDAQIAAIAASSVIVEGAPVWRMFC